MKPKMKWIESFDLEIEINGKKAKIQGNEIHANLKNYENIIRHRQLNISAILNKEEEMAKLKANKALDISEKSRQRRVNRVHKLSIELIKYLFEKNCKKDDPSDYRGRFKEKFLSEFEKKLNRKNLNQEISWKMINKNYLSHLNNKEFDTINEDSEIIKNGLIIDLLEFLDKNNIRFIGIIDSAFISYKKDVGMSASTGKNRAIEKKVLTLLDDSKKSQPEFSIETKSKIEALQKEIENLRAHQNITEIKGNIVIASMGFVVEIKSPNQESKFHFIHFPITARSKDIHNIYDQFNQSYNYLTWTSDQKQINRNSLIDKQLDSQIFSKEEFNKQLDYHSERDLYLHIQNPLTIEYLVSNLKKSMKEKLIKEQELYKVHFVILDIHSSRYMCKRCQLATTFMQDPDGEFLSCLSNHLKKNFKNNEIIPDDKLKLFTRVSSDISFVIPKVEAINHGPLTRIANKLTEYTILAMDTESINISMSEENPSKISTINQFKQGLHKYTLFTSSENDNPTRDIILAYKDLTAKTKDMAAKHIQSTWRAFKNNR